MNEQTHKAAQLVLKNKSKTAGLNMTINIQSNPKQEISSNANTYRGTCKSQQKYAQMVPEETHASRLSQAQKS